VERALKLYVRNHDIAPSWEAVGAELLKYASASGSGPAALKVGRRDAGLLAGAAPE